MFAVRPHKEAIRHGGGLEVASLAHPNAQSPWLDLSTGINPDPYPATPATAAARARLSDPLELSQLERTAAHFFGTVEERVAAVSGAETAIRLLPVLLGKVTVDIVGPTYGAHAESWRSAFIAPHMITSDQARTSGADVLVIVNPNNPDGHVFSTSELTSILRKREDDGRWLVIDESFAECLSGASMAGVKSPRLIVLRSFGKFFGLAGVRLGFAIGSPAFKASLRNLTGDWPVCADAIAMGTQAYADEEWIEAARQTLSKRAGQLDRLLTNAGFLQIGGTSLFRLVRHPQAQQWFWQLCRRGILTRPFDHTPDLLRFGVPSVEGLSRVEIALEKGL